MCPLVGLGQSSVMSGKNNPYSPSPNRKPKQAGTATQPQPTNTVTGNISFAMQAGGRVPDDAHPVIDVRPTIAQTTYKTARAEEINSLSPTDFYKIGIGDVLFVSLRNIPQSSGYFTVRADGTIDYPLAGERVSVADLTPDAAEELIISGIKLFPDPQVDIKVREYASHKIVVSGLVESPGEKYMQREAMPLFVIKAEAVVRPTATKVAIKRDLQAKSEIYDLGKATTDEILIYPGDTIEFSNEGSTAPRSGNYFIGGEIVNSGQKDLSYGLTLYQAVVVSGGTKGDPRKAIIRRKNEQGTFHILEHNLRAIKNGKAMDPLIAVGDIIEIKN